MVVRSEYDNDIFCYDIGFYDSNEEFVLFSRVKEFSTAIALMNLLNGGSRPRKAAMDVSYMMFKGVLDVLRDRLPVIDESKVFDSILKAHSANTSMSEIEMAALTYKNYEDFISMMIEVSV